MCSVVSSVGIQICCYYQEMNCQQNELHSRQVANLCPTKPHLTHLSLASLLWDMGKQNSPRCDAAERGVPFGAILFA